MHRPLFYLRASLLTGFALTLAIAASTTPAFAQTLELTAVEEQSIDAYVSLLRQDVNAEKVSLIGQVMQFSPEEASTFWPLYSAYSKELAALGDQKLALIKDYATHYETMTEAKADELVLGVLDLEQQRTALKRTHYGTSRLIPLAGAASDSAEKPLAPVSLAVSGTATHLLRAVPYCP